MDYLLACPYPSQVSYVLFLHAYANGCFILSLPFIESSAKIEYDFLLRKRFLCDANVRADIDKLVLEAAWMPLFPARFFEVRVTSFGRALRHFSANHSPQPAWGGYRRQLTELRVNVPAAKSTDIVLEAIAVESPSPALAAHL